jgi:protein-histidine pros-kinase
MKLIVKFNLVLLAVGGVGFAATAALSYQLLQDKAHAETVQNARLMLATAVATRTFTDTNVRQLLEPQMMKVAFTPEAMPSFAATEAFSSLTKMMPGYLYKEATLNPTNPRDRTADWEADVVGQFRQDPKQRELVGERETPTGRSLYLARPITINDSNCLACHDTPAAAPKTLVDKYGPANGFGWKLHEIVGAQIVSVPTQLQSDNVRATFIAFMTSMAAVYAAAFVALNLMLMFFVVRPLGRLSAVAERVSRGDAQVPDFEATGADEIKGLARAFARMRTSLRKAIEMIEPSSGIESFGRTGPGTAPGAAARGA